MPESHSLQTCSGVGVLSRGMNVEEGGFLLAPPLFPFGEQDQAQGRVLLALLYPLTSGPLGAVSTPARRKAVNAEVRPRQHQSRV